MKCNAAFSRYLAGVPLLLVLLTTFTLADERPNVLFIALDDMNDWIGCYGGHPDAQTPNIDRLARRGVLFTNAHCVSPICGPSRASVLTGMRPETTGVYHNRGKYFEMYDRNTVRLPQTIRNDLADVSPPGRYLATKPWTSGTHETVTKHDAWRDAVHAYLATVSFVDTLVGNVVAALDSGPHADNTWIVLWSDHGWSLGEKQHWGKHVPWTECVRVPLVIIPPRRNPPRGFQAGSRCQAHVSLLDLYPTMTDSCGLPRRENLEGQSLLPLIGNPNSKWNEAAVSTIGRGTHSVATDRWRYIRYFDGSEELYDLRQDPEEWTNIASRPENEEVKRRLATHIPQDERWKRFVRWGRWKCVFPVEGNPMLFDYEADFGISEQDDVAEKNPDIVRAIQSYVRQSGVDDRRVTMPSRGNKQAATKPENATDSGH